MIHAIVAVEKNIKNAMANNISGKSMNMEKDEVSKLLSKKEEKKGEKPELSPLAFFFTKKMKHKDPQQLLKAIDLYQEKKSIVAILQSEELSSLELEDIYQCIKLQEKFQELELKQKKIIEDIQSKGLLKEGLEKKIKSSFNNFFLEDIHRPYKLKGRTTAIAAKEQGLGLLADWIWKQGHGIKDEKKSLEEKAKEFIKKDSLKTIEEVLSETQSIIVEKIAEETEIRAFARNSILQKARLRSVRTPKAKDKSKYKRFFNYQESLSSIRTPAGCVRYLMMRKAQSSNEILLSFEQNNQEEIIKKYEDYSITKEAPASIAAFLKKAVSIAINSNVNTALHYEAHKLLKEHAEAQVLRLFSKDLRNRIMQAVFGAKSVIGIDPAQDKKTCSIVLLDDKGKLLAHKNFSLKEKDMWSNFYNELIITLKKISVKGLAILHGPHTKEIQDRLKSLLKEKDINLPIITIYEQSSTIYSTSAVGKKELPDLHASIRRAVFIGRFLQNPTSELIKIDPRFLVPWTLNLDISPQKLRDTFSLCISYYIVKIGLNINTANQFLLSYLPNMDIEKAKIIVEYRKKKTFDHIEELKDILNLEEDKWKEIKTLLRVSSQKEDLRGPYQIKEAKIEDTELKINTKIKGIVSSITSFGIFVNIGLDYDALIHISEFKNKKGPYGEFFISKSLEAWLVSYDHKKKQASLSLRTPEERISQRKSSFKRKKERIRKKDKQEKNSKRHLENKFTAKKERKAHGKASKKTKRKKIEQRDPKTGALIKKDLSIHASSKKRTRLPEKAKVTTYNPFADLDKIIKKSKE